MYKWFRITCFIAVCMMIAVSCRQLYTSSFASAIARQTISISNSTSVAGLLAIAQGNEGTDPAVAKSILAALGTKTSVEITALSTDDKTTILNLGITAAIELSAIDAIFSGYNSATSDTNALIESAFAAFDTSVNLAAIQTLLTDPTTLATAPVDSIVLASAVVLADVAAEIGTTQIMGIMGAANPAAALDAAVLAGTVNVAQKASISNIINVVNYLDNTRPDADMTGVSFGGFNLVDLLKGTP